jgi:hypothetical protein
MKDADRENEIRRIEADLRNFQRRYANLDRSARRVRMSFYFLIAVLAAFIVAGAVMGHPAPLVASAMPLSIVILSAWAIARLYPELRWIDYVGWSPGYWRWAVKQTEAMAVEHMVAERLERLARLKGNYK